ncbi:hypothetical protein UA08_07140 [Talaromyces atroroseus]|uniref:BCD1 alpha/beta domain-containing protein n=1 Tax=Talaromyces atroroseus TaxID=1441469 RepID=A0A225ABT1_TALAT|nr:hypothetical protein UA08_07140 [Talaromyces atroroseus]OKL57780.1 hypothetical protein UA08_07140 [Talaromyces atroroseus]
MPEETLLSELCTAYHTRSQLQDPASFDRDFNFITGIERGLERAEREADRRGIQLEHEYMLDANNQKASSSTSSRNKRKRGGVGAATLVRGELAFVRAAEAAGVKLARAPRGLSRQKANRSRVHPKHKCLNWSVEWILASNPGQTLIRPCLETTPLREAYDRVFPRPKEDATATATATVVDDVLSYRSAYFYLHRQRAAASHRRTVLVGPLSPTATLREVLRGRSVVEFPTLYVLPDVLKEGDTENARFVLEEVYLREHPGDVDVEGEEEDEEEDYTSSEGSSSDETSDDDDDDEEEEEAEVEKEKVEEEGLPPSL